MSTTARSGLASFRLRRAATLGSCLAVLLVPALSRSAPSAAPHREPAGGVEHRLDDGGGAPPVTSPRRASAARRSHAQVASLIPRLEPGLRSRVAGAIVAEAELAGLDPLLVLALIQIESSFDPSAVSTAGAAGLMQLREPTMLAEAARSRLSSTDRLDPVASIQAGVRYLRRLIAAFGDTDLALMAYNAGPNRIVKHLRNGEIPERFHSYPRKVKEQLHRLSSEAGVRAAR